MNTQNSDYSDEDCKENRKRGERTQPKRATRRPPKKKLRREFNLSKQRRKHLQKRGPSGPKPKDNIWAELAKKKRLETHQSFLEDCFGKKFDRFDFEDYLKRCIEELDTWLFHSKKDRVKIDTSRVAQDAVGKGAKVSRVRMPDLNMDQIDRIMRTEEGNDALSLKPNLQISRLIQKSQLVGFRAEKDTENRAQVSITRTPR